MKLLLSLVAGLGIVSLLSNCATPPASTNPPVAPSAQVSFGYVFQKMQTDYIEPIGRADLLVRALNGLKSDPDLDRPRAQAILSSAITRAAAIQEDSDTPYLKLFTTALDAVMVYAKASSPVPLVRAALAGMLDGLAGGTAFHLPKIGPIAPGSIGIACLENNIRIVGILAGSPAARSGMLLGDVLVAIDGQPVVGPPWDAALDRLNGPIGSHVSLTVRRGVPPLPVTLVMERSVVSLPNVTVKRLDNVLDVRIFGALMPGVAKQLRREIGVAQSVGPFRALILDLRYNVGGSFEEAVSVSETLLPPGAPIATVEERKLGAPRRIIAKAVDAAPGTPTVVVVNGVTTIGIELIAAALRQGRHAIIIGSHTGDEDMLKETINLGALGSVSLVIGRSLLASGRQIGAGGLTPDVEVPEAPDTYVNDDVSRDRALQAALRTLQAHAGDAR